MRTVLNKCRGLAVLFLCIFLLTTTNDCSVVLARNASAIKKDIQESESELKDIQDSLNNAKREKDELQGALSSANKLIKNLKGSASSLESKIAALDEEITQVQAKIDELDADIASTQAQISQKQLEIDESIRMQEEQYESMKLRIQFMYEFGSSSYVEMLFGAESISEMLNAVEYIASIATYDRQKLEDYEALQHEIEAQKAVLEEQEAALETASAEALENRQALTALQAAKESELSDVKDDIADAQQVAAAYEAEVQAQNEMIAQIQAAEARKREEIAAAKKAAEEAGVDFKEEGSMLDDRYGFLWPCPSSTRITSDYGSRTSPVKGATTNHKGIDIGAKSGADIVASQNGKVAFAGYSRIMGNYVTIDHGNGLYTIYEHASSLNVSTGDYVTRGQVIAKVGSTGISTGSHLHFGVSVNGSYANPWEYVSR